jgi:L-lactate dehydrogenase
MSYYIFEHTKKKSKCAVMGCHGVGAAIAHALCACKEIDALVLLDRDTALASGLAADLCCAMPLDSGLDLWAADSADLADCSVIVLAQGYTNTFENAHADLIELNLPIVRQAALDISALAPDAIVIVVSEPCEIMTYSALQYTGFSPSRVFGVGTLAQTHYYRKLLGRYLGIDPQQLNAMILGQVGKHGTLCKDSMQVGGMTLAQFQSMIGRGADRTMPDSLFSDTVQVFEQAEGGVGCAAFAVAQAVSQLVNAILCDTHTILPVCTASCAAPKSADCCISLPCRIDRKGAHALYDFPLSKAEHESLVRTAARLHAQICDLHALLYNYHAT